MGITYDYYAKIENNIITLTCWEDYEDCTAFASGEKDYYREIKSHVFDNFEAFYKFTKTFEYTYWKDQIPLFCDIVEHYKNESRLKTLEINRVIKELKEIDNVLKAITPIENQTWDKRYKNKLKNGLTRIKKTISNHV